jgi:hypothetical protein
LGTVYRLKKITTGRQERIMFNYGTKFAGLGTGVFPNFAAKNASGPTATDGFPFTADSVNDWIGFHQALLNRAGLTPNGQAEANGASQLIQALIQGAAQRPGDLVYTAIATSAIRAQHRLLDLTGQIIAITGTYAALAANVYVGDAANPSAGAFYKCDASGNRTTSGAYMRMPDCRGIFLRGTGAQTRTITWTDSQGVSHSINTTYDGKVIGTFIGDAIRRIWGSINANGAVAWQLPYGAFYLDEETSPGPASRGDLSKPTLLVFDSSRAVPTDSSNHPASISAMICITF